MKRSELEHVLRASAAITLDDSFVVIGSQAVLPDFPDAPAKLHCIGELTPVCPDLHDIALSKCVAGRDKDADWVRALLRHGMIRIERLAERLNQLDATPHPPAHLIAWAQRRAQEAQA